MKNLPITTIILAMASCEASKPNPCSWHPTNKIYHEESRGCVNEDFYAPEFYDDSEPYDLCMDCEDDNAKDSDDKFTL
jgi:hypothetical protein